MAFSSVSLAFVVTGFHATCTSDLSGVTEEGQTKIARVLQGRHGWSVWSGPSRWLFSALCPSPAPPTPCAHDWPPRYLLRSPLVMDDPRGSDRPATH